MSSARLHLHRLHIYLFTFEGGAFNPLNPEYIPASLAVFTSCFSVFLREAEGEEEKKDERVCQHRAPASVIFTESFMPIAFVCCVILAKEKKGKKGKRDEGEKKG